MGALRKTMEYLGLSEPERNEDLEYVVTDDDAYDPSHDDAALPTPDFREVASHTAPVTPISTARSAVPSGDLRRITTVHPRAYNDAKVIGEAFRSGTPVIMNLTELSDSDAKRLVDFSAGIVFGLHGSIERVTNKVFLLSPATIEVTSESASPESGARLFNQG